MGAARWGSGHPWITPDGLGPEGIVTITIVIITMMIIIINVDNDKLMNDDNDSNT